MRRLELTTADLRSAALRDDLVDPDGVVAVLDLDGPAVPADRVATLPVVLVGAGDASSPAAALCDVVIDGEGVELDAILETVEAAPRAATSLVLLLRQTGGCSVASGLIAESGVYSALQAGPEFARWRAANPSRPRGDETGDVVRVGRVGDRLEIVLDRPQARNAFDTAMRDRLWEALSLAAADPGVRVHLRGAGPDFCAGGDLDEFGSVPDPATGHLVRLGRHVGAAIDSLAGRVTVDLHGACIGSGIELPAFASRVRARDDTRIRLPELRMGLIPGAGGTVSITRRAGRHATAYLALTAATIDAATALAWGLVDEITDGEGSVG